MAFPLLDILGIGSKLIDKLIPDPGAKAAAQLELAKLAQTGELAQLAADTEITKAQLAINLADAQRASKFQSWPRPFLMWVGGVGMAYQWVILPGVTFVYTLKTGHGLPAPLPEIDGNLMVMLGGLMGVQIGARSYEKVRGVAAK